MAISSDEMEVDLGHVLFELGEQFGPGRFIEHVALVARPGRFAQGAKLWVRDWPYTYQERVAEEDEVCERVLKVDIANMAVGWVEEGEYPHGPNLFILDTESRNIMRTSITKLGGGVDDKLYSSYPARTLDYSPQAEDGGVIFPFKGSCVGFVEECFERAFCDIVVDQDSSRALPIWTWSELEGLRSFLDWPPGYVERMRCRFQEYPRGLPLLLPGYQFAAFRQCGPYPYSPPFDKSAAAST